MTNYLISVISNGYHKLTFFMKDPRPTTIGTICCIWGKGIRFKDYNTNQKPNRQSAVVMLTIRNNNRLPFRGRFFMLGYQPLNGTQNKRARLCLSDPLNDSHINRRLSFLALLISKVTLSPSLRDLNPGLLMPEWWTNTNFLRLTPFGALLGVSNSLLHVLSQELNHRGTFTHNGRT